MASCTPARLHAAQRLARLHQRARVLLLKQEDMMGDRALLQSFASYFLSRRDDFARQTETGRYVRVGRPVSSDDLLWHLQGQQTIGTYVIDERGLCRFAVYDADTDDGLLALWHVQQALAAQGIGAHLEHSRRGAHLWVFLAQRLAPSLVRRWLLPFCPAGVEFYPKQDQTNGYGSLIRVPCGVHRLSGRRYPFVVWNGERWSAVAETVSDLLAYLSAFPAAVPPAGLSETSPIPETVQHPPTIANHSHGTLPASGSSRIAAWCAAQNPLTVIGRYVELDSRGVGRCPFGSHHRSGQDRHPSFRVFEPSTPGGTCWYCYASGQGGNIFNFLSLYYGLDAATLWQRLQAGGVF